MACVGEGMQGDLVVDGGTGVVDVALVVVGGGGSVMVVVPRLVVGVDMESMIGVVEVGDDDDDATELLPVPTVDVVAEETGVVAVECSVVELPPITDVAVGT